MPARVSLAAAATGLVLLGVASAAPADPAALAIAISWSQHKSILWAIVHGILSWLYVLYYAVTR
jgi:hypothetical protein